MLVHTHQVVLLQWVRSSLPSLTHLGNYRLGKHQDGVADPWGWPAPGPSIMWGELSAGTSAKVRESVRVPLASIGADLG